MLIDNAKMVSWRTLLQINLAATTEQRRVPKQSTVDRAFRARSRKAQTCLLCVVSPAILVVVHVSA